jgi:hypothetical protein
MKYFLFKSFCSIAVICLLAFTSFAQTTQNSSQTGEKAEAVIQKAIRRLGGERYLTVKTIVGRGNFTQIAENTFGVPSAFVDYIVFPDKERTEFKLRGVKTIQTNTGETGWVFDGAAKAVTEQTPDQVTNFKQSIRTSLDNLLRGGWRKENAKLEYVGRREASLGRRNEVVKLTYPDDFSVEFEFAAEDATPAKSIYKRKSAEGEVVKEEDRYAQFVEVAGVFTPFIIEHYTNGKPTSRINYQTIEFNTPIDNGLFAKPADVKKLK